jgi:hypothetical protein
MKDSEYLTNPLGKTCSGLLLINAFGSIDELFWVGQFTAIHEGRYGVRLGNTTRILVNSLMEMLVGNQFVEPGSFHRYKFIYIRDSGHPKIFRKLFKINGRGERIRTSDPLVPNQVLYQAEPLPEHTAKAAYCQLPKPDCRGQNARAFESVPETTHPSPPPWEWEGYRPSYIEESR